MFVAFARRAVKPSTYYLHLDYSGGAMQGNQYRTPSLILISLLFTGCAANVALSELAGDHPANPNAPEAPPASVSKTLQSYKAASSASNKGQPKGDMKDRGSMEGMSDREGMHNMDSMKGMQGMSDREGGGAPTNKGGGQ